MEKDNNSNSFFKIIGGIIVIILVIYFLGAVSDGIETVIYGIQPIIPYLFWGGVIIYILSQMKSKK
jgi:uncharacterized membrane protein YbhN (UPF0104 family)